MPALSLDAPMSSTTISSAPFSLKIRTVLIGSPTYFGDLNRTVLYRPSFISRRAGMIRILFMEVQRNLRSVSSHTYGSFPGGTGRDKCFLFEKRRQNHSNGRQFQCRIR